MLCSDTPTCTIISDDSTLDQFEFDIMESPCLVVDVLVDGQLHVHSHCAISRSIELNFEGLVAILPSMLARPAGSQFSPKAVLVLLPTVRVAAVMWPGVIGCDLAVDRDCVELTVNGSPRIHDALHLVRAAGAQSSE